MMSNGFITPAGLLEDGFEEIETTRLQVEDNRIGEYNEDDTAISIYIDAIEAKLLFSLPEAEQLAEALSVIILRYPKPTEGK